VVTYVKEEFSSLDAKAKYLGDSDEELRRKGLELKVGWWCYANWKPSPIRYTFNTEAIAEALNDDKVGVKEAVTGVLANLAMKPLLSGNRPMYLLQSRGQTMFENIK
jgi:hypothetical protein